MALYLEEIEKADITCPPKSLKNLSENIEDILIEKQFKGQKLVSGWEKVDQDEENDSWVAREEEDCQRDYEHFVHDLIESMDARYNTCVSTMCCLLKWMDLEEIFTLLCGHRQRGKPVINEVQLEKFGNEDFKKFVAHVCKLKHVQSAIENGRLEMDLSHVIYRKMKQALKYLLWKKKDVMLKWFLLTTKKKSLTTLATEVPSNASVLQSFSLSVPKAKSPTPYTSPFTVTKKFTRHWGKKFAFWSI